MAALAKPTTEPLALRTRDGETVISRCLIPADAPELTSFYRKLDERTDRLYFVLSEYTEAVASDMARRQSRGHEMHLVLEAPEGEIVGHLSLQPFPGECPRVGVCVAGPWQARGLGRQWMEVALQLVSARPGRRGAWLSVLRENTVAIALYESLGFYRVREYSVTREWSRFPANVGCFAMVDMLLRLPAERGIRRIPR